MHYRITQLTKIDAGTYNESGDILPDMLAGDACPDNLSDILDWLAEQGFLPADGFVGWGHVLRHAETGDLLSITER